MLPDYILYLHSVINGCHLDGAAGVLHGLGYSILSRASRAAKQGLGAPTVGNGEASRPRDIAPSSECKIYT
jgi:hypothetical protein